MSNTIFLVLLIETCVKLTGIYITALKFDWIGSPRNRRTYRSFSEFRSATSRLKVWTSTGHYQYIWIWFRDLKESCKCYCSFTAGGFGDSQCCLVVLDGILIYLLFLMNPSPWSADDWSCSTLDFVVADFN
ncbi:hypothetical protein Q3G72_000453 [Acer saccharum]|nr:hypothetical protein Q3G72_000453 [Acer saccharum]